MQRQWSVGVLAAGAVAFGLLVVARPASAQNLLTNGSLDQTYQQEITPGLTLPKPANWENVGTRAVSGPYEDELSSEPWAGPAPTPVTTNDMGVFFKGFSGNTANGAATGHLYQDNPATPGTRYTLTGWAGAEANYLGGAQLALEFLDSGGTAIPASGSVLDLVANGLFTPNGQPFNYKQFTVSALAPVGAATVRSRISMVNGRNNPEGGGQAYVVDDLRLVPEPGFLAAILPAGLLLMRRRRSA